MSQNQNHVIKTANQRKGKYPKKPIRIQSKASKLLKARENKKTAQSAGKQANCSKARENVGFRVVIVLLYIWLVKNFWTNHRANQRKTKAIPDNFGHSLEDCPFNLKTKLNPSTPLKSFHLGVEVIRDRHRFPKLSAMIVPENLRHLSFSQMKTETNRDLVIHVFPRSRRFFYFPIT